ncbi:MAG TPA: DEAD/DEAH box helicase [Streptosporangiaceae bacterium]|nr:DEAD/DEAH box helicase [Streptosporangiaceae bacterium]
MDVFGVRDQLVEDYREYTGSFVDVHDPRIRAHVAQRMAEGYQWPDPWVSLNPNFAPGGTITELVQAGLLHPECERIFRLKDEASGASGPVLRLHRHQREAVEIAREGHSYVLTTGTGSGKSLTYIIPIVDRVLRARADGSWRPGIKAIVVYPMNALANSQLGELGKFLETGFPGGPPVTFARYTGQENEEARQRVIADPPDILLTNYVMLELVLTRPRERRLIEAAHGLEFLVLDELHTYRGRQGADVALLTRRLRHACGGPALQCVGTSATMATEGELAGRQRAVAKVASDLFGIPVQPEHVIGETLERVTDPAAVTPDAVRRRVSLPLAAADYGEFVKDPLAGWAEQVLGFEPGSPADAPVRRRRPLTLPEAATQLTGETGVSRDTCLQAIKGVLEAGARLANPATGRPVFAFRLHQFLSKGDNVYVTLEPPGQRHITSTYQIAAPGGATEGGPQRILLPTAFCRECGQEYLAVTRLEDGDSHRYEARRDNDASGGDDASGYLYISEDDDQPWPFSLEEVLTDGRLPYSWLRYDLVEGQVVDPGRIKALPEPVHVDLTGRETEPGEGTGAAYVSSPFRFCLRCRSSYEQARGNDFAKLAKLSTEGRSSAMSLITASVVRTLRSRNGDLDPRAKKLLAFVDNRQDASLQSGHFNDFVQVTQLRGALFRALAHSPAGLTDEIVAQRVTDALGLTMADFARNPGARFSQRDEAWRALREVIGYHLYLDLERGWRVTMPNLEQTGLLRIRYRDLAEIAAEADVWAGCHYALRDDSSEHRGEIAVALLDELRRNLAIDVEWLSEDGFERVRRLSAQHLREPWSLPEREQSPTAGVAFPGPGKRGLPRHNLFLSGRGQFGRFLIREYANQRIKLGTTDAQEIITNLFEVLADTGLLTEAVPAEGDGAAGYRLRAAVVSWLAGDGKSGAEDRVRRTLDNEDGPRVNPFFRDLYSSVAATLAGLRSKEHTAQVAPAERQDREREFSEAQLPVLYCSPTLELGVDISALSAVALRNVPPTPANYAQRAGRAGRSGQPALVVTYCATGNAHDQYYFRRPTAMVGGAVAPPRLDLANEDLIRSHVHAVWLAETAQDLHSSLTELLDVGGERPTLDLLPKVRQRLADPDAARRAAQQTRTLLGSVLRDLEAAPWWRKSWIEDAVAEAPRRFDEACQRWKDLYRVALEEFHVQSRRSVDVSVPARERDNANRRARDARVQLSLLRNEDAADFQTDFYSYRYFASEGFLPGYSFPRLPLAAYIPGLTGRRDGDYIQRPRFIGISEFGPGAVIYHEGARYQVFSVQLPPADPGQDGLATSSARRCRDCGYLHDEAVGIDVCDNCGEPLRDTTRSLLRLTAVRTRRRDRISSDEEERRRAGFELQTSYRFAQHGSKPGRAAVTVSGEEGPLLQLTYGDSATVRRANVGRTRRVKQDVHGYVIDITTGRWLRETEPAGETSPDEADLDSAKDVRRAQRVIPYVEDRRNILVTRLAHPVSPETAVTAAIALERGIEAAFQLEDSELASEMLPDPARRGRALLVESAEGGAGALRRLVDDPGALAQTARTALEIMHFDPVTGDDLSRDEPGRERCVLACYECLLSYSNQTMHRMINRHLVRDLMLQLASISVQPPTQAAGPRDVLPEPRSRAAAAFLAWLRARDFRLPDDVDADVCGARPDFVYRLDDGNAAVFVADDGQENGHAAGRGERARDDLRDLGWSVITVAGAGGWADVTARYPSIFGSS